MKLPSTSNFTPEQKIQYDLRHYPVRPHVGVGGVILWHDYVVIIKRKYAPNQGLWAIPGGHLKLGEKAADGALRECKEETGLNLQVDRLASVIDLIEYDEKDQSVEYHYVLCDYFLSLVGYESFSTPPMIQPQSDALEAKFVRFSDLKNYTLTKTVIELFKNLNFIPKELFSEFIK